PVFAPVPDGEREHAVDLLQRALDPVFGDRLNQNFGIGAAAPVAPAARLQLHSELAEIIDLAVVGEHISLARRQHGLMPCGRKVNDSKALMTKLDWPFGPQSI